MGLSNIAVFIDFENFGNPDIFNAKILVEKLKEKGRLIVKKAYADWGRYAQYKRQMLENSIELTELPSHGKRGKNSADIKLVVDALEVAITKEYIDTIVVVSGDSDYTPLISKLREYNKYVIVVGDKKSVSELLKGYCDELIYYSTLIGQQEVNETDVHNACDLLTRALILMEKEGHELRGSQIKSTMRQLDSSFDESNYGFSQFRKFLKAAQEKGIIKLSPDDVGSDVIAELVVEHADDSEVMLSFEHRVNRVLAKIRKQGMQFLGAELQQQVIQAIFDVLTTTNEFTARGDIINQLVEQQLATQIEALTLSKNKINCIFKIFLYGGALVRKKESEDSSMLLKLKPEYHNYDDFSALHDAVFMVVADVEGLSWQEWGIFLHDDETAFEDFNTSVIETVTSYLEEEVLMG